MGLIDMETTTQIFEPVLFTKINVTELGKSKPSVILPLVSLLSVQMCIGIDKANELLNKSVQYN